MAAMSEAPQYVQDLIQRHLELLNKPRIGLANNWAYAMAQLNLATTKKAQHAAGMVATMGIQILD
jgi:hypothetical protein